MIRSIQVSDAEAVCRICNCALGHQTAAQTIIRQTEELSDNPNYYVAVYEDDETHQVLGFIQAEKYNLLYGGNGWNIIALAVETQAQKRGIGSRLLCSLEEYAESIGYSFVRLNCNITRNEAHAFYEKHGYDCDKTQKRIIRQLMN